VLEKRDRWDAISALSRHDIGYHTDFHSVHPTITEYLREMDWDEGIREFERRETPGFWDLERIFRTGISCYGQPGGAWAPQAFPVLKSWDVIYVDEGDNIGMNDEPFWFCNVLTVFRMRSNCHRAALWGDNHAFRHSLEHFDHIYHRLSETGGLISIFYHPTEFVNAEFWDGVNYRHGVNTDPKDWKMPRQRSLKDIETGYQRFREYLRHICSKPSIEIVTAGDLPGLYPDPVMDDTFSPEEIHKIAQHSRESIQERQVGPGFLSPAEQFALLARFLTPPDRKSQPSAVPLRQPLGPKVRVASQGLPLEASWETFLDAVQQADHIIESTGHLPDQVDIMGYPIAPADLMGGMAEACCALLGEGKPPSQITLQPAEFRMEQYVEDSNHLWDWVIFPEDFTAPKVIELTKLQSWTLKPATLSG